MRKVSRLSTALGLAAALVPSLWNGDARAERVETSRQTFSAPAKRAGEKEVEVLKVQTARDDEKGELYFRFLVLDKGKLYNWQVEAYLPNGLFLEETRVAGITKDGEAKSLKTIPFYPKKEKSDFGERLKKVIEGSADLEYQVPGTAKDIAKLLSFYEEWAPPVINHKDAEERGIRMGLELRMRDSFFPRGNEIPFIDNFTGLEYVFVVKKFQNDVKGQLPNGDIVTVKTPPFNTPLEGQVVFDIGTYGAGNAQNKLTSNTAFFKGRVGEKKVERKAEKKAESSREVRRDLIETYQAYLARDVSRPGGKLGYVTSTIDRNKGELSLSAATGTNAELAEVYFALIVPKSFEMTEFLFNRERVDKSRLNNSDGNILWRDDPLFWGASDASKDILGVELSGKNTSLQTIAEESGRKIISVSSRVAGSASFQIKYNPNSIGDEKILGFLFARDDGKYRTPAGQYRVAVPFFKSSKIYPPGRN